MGHSRPVSYAMLKKGQWDEREFPPLIMKETSKRERKKDEVEEVRIVEAAVSIEGSRRREDVARSCESNGRPRESTLRKQYLSVCVLLTHYCAKITEI